MPIVLHVEDDEGDAHLVVRSLAQSACRVRIARASDGNEAIKMLEDVENGQRERPALILLDLRLPKVSGREVLRRAKASPALKDIPVVVFTSADGDEERIGCLEDGCDEYVPKPIDYTLFRAAVNSICKKYLLTLLDAEPAPQKVRVL